MINRIPHWSFWIISILFALLTAGCNSGGSSDDGSDAVDETTPIALREYKLVWSDEFNEGSSPSVEKWRIETGYGDNGWGNDESQLYTDSPDNVRVENGNLVITARCDLSVSGICGVRDGSITSARINTKDKFEFKYGKIQARIKPPKGSGTWPAFWMLGSDFPENPWPGVGEVDIMEMHQFFSNDRVTHFTMHWSGPKYTQEIIEEEEIYCANLEVVGDTPDEGQNCYTQFKEFDEPLTDDFHIFEAEWDENQITGKIDDIVYFRKTIDPDEMEEFLNSFFIILNVAVDGTLGGPPDEIITTPQEMLVDWVRVYRKESPSTVGLIPEGDEVEAFSYERIINSVELGGNSVEADLTSTAVTPLDGDMVMELDYTSANAFFSGAAFEFNAADLSDYTKIVFSLDTSAFPDFYDIGIELSDSQGFVYFVLLSDYTPTVSDNWQTYEIPLSDFTLINLDDVMSFGFWNPSDVDYNLTSGVLYVDDIRLIEEECTATPSVEFDAMSYLPSATLAQIRVSDPCAASSLATVKIETANDAIVVGADLDATGNGETFIEFGSPISICPVSDETSSIVLEDPLDAIYFAVSPDGSIDNKAYARTSIDPNAIPTDFVGEQSYIIANDPAQPTAFAIDVDFNLSDFGSGSIFDSSFIDPAFSSYPVWSISNTAGSAAVFAMFDFTSGFTSGQESINFKVKDMPDNVVLVKFGDTDPDFTVDLTNTSYSTPLQDAPGWYEISIPMSNFPSIDTYNYLVIKSNVLAVDSTFLVTDIYLEERLGTRGPECAAPVESAPAPTEDPTDVKSMFSNTYGTEIYVDTWSASFDTADLDDVQLNEDDIKRYSNMGFAAVETVTSPIDASTLGMTNFRMDVWSSQVSSLLVKWVDFGGDGFGLENDTEGSVTLPLTTDEWTSLDIPLSDFIANGLTANPDDLSQLIFEAKTGSGNIFLDNVYFYDDGTGGAPPAPTEPTTAAPVPSQDAVNVISLFSDNYTDVPVDTWLTVWSSATLDESFSVDGSATKLYTDLDFAGIEMTTTNVDASGMTHFHIDIWTPDSTDTGEVFRVKLVNFGATTTEGEIAFSATTTPAIGTGTWISLDIPLADFADSTKVTDPTKTLGDTANIAQLILSATLGGGPGLGTVYVDNVYFYNVPTVPPVAAPVPSQDAVNVISLFSDNYTDVPVDTWLTVWSSATLDESFSVDGSATKLYTDLDFAGIEMTTTNVDASGMTHFHIDIWTPDSTDTGEVFRVKLVNFGATTTEGEIAFSATTTPAIGTGTWISLDIPLADFADSTKVTDPTKTLGDTANIAQLILSATLGGGPGLGTVYVDNVYFYNSAAGGVTNLVTDGGFEAGDLTLYWIIDPVGGTGTATADNTEARTGIYSANLLNLVASGPPLIMKQPNMGLGTVATDDVLDVSFWAKGNIGDTCALTTKLIYEGTGGTPTTNTTVETTDLTNWTEITFSGIATGDVAGGVTLEFTAACGPTTSGFDVNIDDLSVTIQ